MNAIDAARPALLAGAAILGLLVSPAVANAEKVWDIEQFDICTEVLDDGINESQQDKWDETKFCCEKSGGEWSESQKKCQAPPAESTTVPKGNLPTVTVQPPTVATAPPKPALPVVPGQPIAR